MAGPLPIKCVVVGPSKSGKTSLLLNLTTKETVDGVSGNGVIDLHDLISLES